MSRRSDAGGQFRQSRNCVMFFLLMVTDPPCRCAEFYASLIVVPLTMVVCLCALLPGGAQAQSTGTPQRPGVAVLDFNYIDTSGETNSRMVEHQEWLGALAAGLRADFASTGTYRLIAPACRPAPCEVGAPRSMSFRARRKRRGPAPRHGRRAQAKHPHSMGQGRCR